MDGIETLKTGILDKCMTCIFSQAKDEKANVQTLLDLCCQTYPFLREAPEGSLLGGELISQG